VLLCQVYGYQEGDWKAIIVDPKVIRLEKSRKQLMNHIAFLKTKNNNTVASRRGERLKETIVESLQVQQQLEMRPKRMCLQLKFISPLSTF